MIVVNDNHDIYLYRSDNGKASAVHENVFEDINVTTLQFNMDKQQRKGYFTSDTG